MIELTRINKEKIIINAEEIETIEPSHDTTISLRSGKKISVTENAQEITQKVIEYKRKIFNTNDI
jgi:flagellar protein FlbD